MGMLTNSMDKYMMCPVFKHILNKNIQEGDLILTDYYIGFIQKIILEHDVYNEYNNEFSYRERTQCKIFYCYNEPYYSNIDSSSIIYDINENSNGTDFIVITKELFDLILKYVPYDVYRKIVQVCYTKEEYDDNWMTRDRYFLYMLMYRLYTYINSLITDDMDKMILLSFGIKKVLKKHKNNGLREVLLGNGQVWLLKKKKTKGFWGRQIYKKNKKNELFEKEYRNKSVTYKVIKRLDKYEVVIS